MQTRQDKMTWLQNPNPVKKVTGGRSIEKEAWSLRPFYTLHREGGPAVIKTNGVTAWWVDNVQYLHKTLEDTIKLMKAIKKYKNENDL